VLIAGSAAEAAGAAAEAESADALAVGEMAEAEVTDGAGADAESRPANAASLLLTATSITCCGVTSPRAESVLVLASERNTCLRLCV
jgi:hypothetical protein